MEDPDFVLPTDPRIERERLEDIDVYRQPRQGTDSGSVVFVHGGPVATGDSPRDRRIFTGYGSLAASHGLVGVTFNHRLHSPGHASTAAGDIAAAIDHARRLPGVDPNRIALWFFSGSGLISADWMRDPPSWLRCLALTYPILDADPAAGVDPRYRPIDAVADAGELPILLTRAGRERPEFAEGVTRFVGTARSLGARLDIVDVPHGQHSFDVLDHTDESRHAVNRAMEWVVEHIR